MAATQRNTLPTDFDDDMEPNEGVKAQEPPKPQAPAKDENGVPYCLKHHVRMKQTSGGKRGAPAAYYSCPVDGCEETAKRIKTTRESSIPSEPHKCPRCSRGKSVVVLERSKRRSTGFYSILECPECGYASSPMPRPEFVAAQVRRTNREQIADLGER